MKFKNYSFVLTFLLCSCVNQIDNMVMKSSGDKQHFYMLTAWGGVHAAESSAGTRYTGNLENSFQVAAQAALSYGLSLNQTKVLLEKELTDRYKSGQITIQEFNKLKFGLETVKSNNELTAFIAAIPKT